MLGLCVFCGKPSRGLFVKRTFYYPDGYDTHLEYRRYYHAACLRKVLANPEKYGNRALDKAIWVAEYVKQHGETTAKEARFQSMSKRRRKAQEERRRRLERVRKIGRELPWFRAEEDAPEGESDGM